MTINSETNIIRTDENITQVKTLTNYDIDPRSNTNTSEPLMNNSTLPINNVICNKGLCFICTHNFSLLNYGIKCQKCSRVYHAKCLKNNGIYREFYIWKVCTLRDK